MNENSHLPARLVLPDSQNASFDPAAIVQLLGKAADFLQQVARVAVVVIERFTVWAEQEERRYERGVVRRACLRRRQWKVSDVKRLEALPNCPLSSAQRLKLTSSNKRGRPVVPQYRSLTQLLVERVRIVKALHGADTAPHARIKALKQTGLLGGVAEALYRGCYAAAKSHGHRAPSAQAEIQAATLLTVSAATLRKLCAQVRRARRIDGDPMGPALPAAEYRQWLKTGGDTPGG